MVARGDFEKMNLNVWNNPPKCGKCDRAHWGKCETKELGAFEKNGENGSSVTIITPPTEPEKNHPDWQGTSRQTPKVNQTEILKEKF